MPKIIPHLSSSYQRNAFVFTLGSSLQKASRQGVSRKFRSAFSLVEILITLTIVLALVFSFLILVPGFRRHAQQAASLNNLRQIGTALRLYASDHDGSLPKRTDVPGLQWPTLLLDYLNNDPRVYAEPGSKKNYMALNQDPRSSQYNHTSYVINGFNDLGTYENEDRVVKIMGIERPSETILLAVQEYHPENFYLDVVLTEHELVFKPDYFNNGSNYLFVDGSARHLRKADYHHELWLADKTYQLQ